MSNPNRSASSASASTSSSATVLTPAAGADGGAGTEKIAGSKGGETAAGDWRGPSGLPRRVHLMGIGGAGVSGAARILLDQGHELSGHDIGASGTLEALDELEISIELCPSVAEVLPADAQCVVRSAAVPNEDPQLLAARGRGLEILRYGELLGRLAPPERCLAMAGTHGKTTSSWMTWYAAQGVAGGNKLRAPGALVGGLCRSLNTNAISAADDGWFCVEACEYDRTFLQLAPFGALITNVEGDHLDYYGSLGAIEEAFARFANRVHASGLLVLGEGVPECVEHAARCTTWRMGRELELDLLGERRGHFRFRLRGPGFCVNDVQLEVPGEFNVANAALSLALVIGLELRNGTNATDCSRAAAAGLEMFLGSARRFEPWGSVGEVEVVHDYAHHPTEVRVTLEAARRALPGRSLEVLFQPHQHSRTARFLEDFAESLRSADRVVVSDVYGARVHSDGARFAGSVELVQALRARRVNAVLGGALESSLDAFVEGLPESAAALVLGAGDVEGVRDDLLRKLALCSPARSRPVL